MLGRAIVISPANRGEQNLRALAAELDAETAHARSAHVEVFDDSAAAGRRAAGTTGRLPRAQQREFDRHFLGSYDRNGSTGFRGMSLFPDGTDGRSINVTFHR